MREPLHVVDVCGDVPEHTDVLSVEHHAADVEQCVVMQNLLALTISMVNDRPERMAIILDLSRGLQLEE